MHRNNKTEKETQKDNTKKERTKYLMKQRKDKRSGGRGEGAQGKIPPNKP